MVGAHTCNPCTQEGDQRGQVEFMARLEYIDPCLKKRKKEKKPVGLSKYWVLTWVVDSLASSLLGASLARKAWQSDSSG